MINRTFFWYAFLFFLQTEHETSSSLNGKYQQPWGIMIRRFPPSVKSSKWIEASTEAPGLVCTLVHRLVTEVPAIPSTYFSPLWIPGLNYCPFPLLSSGVALSAFQKITFFSIFLWIEHLTVDVFIFSSIFMWFSCYTFASFLIHWRYFVFLQSWRKSRKWNSVSRHMGIRAKTCFRCRVFEKYSGFLGWLLRQLGTRNSLFGIHLAQPPSLWALMFNLWSTGSECIAESHSLWETERCGHQRPLAAKVVNEGDNKVSHTRWTSDGARASLLDRHRESATRDMRRRGFLAHPTP